MPDKLTDSKIPDIKELLEYKVKVGCQNCDLIGKGCCSTCVNSLIKSFIGIFDRLQAENEKLKIENSSLSKEIIDTKIEMYKQCIEEMREKIVNTPFDVDLTGKTNEYREGYLDGLVAKQHNILDMLDNLLKELGDNSESAN